MKEEDKESLDILKGYINSKTKHLTDYPSIVDKAIKAVVGRDVADRLKLGIALSELTTLCSHLRKPIKLFDDTIVPVNSISVILSPSGSSKDKSVNAIRKGLTGSYKKLEELRKKYAVETAKQIATINGDSPDSYEKYLEEVIPLLSGLGTPEGIAAHVSDLSTKPLGAGSFMCSEISSELQSNASFTEIIKILSVGYDLGNIPIKVIKSAESRTKEITGMPISGLLFGSYDTLLYQQDIKAKFKLLFTTQLSRRSLFVFTPDVPKRAKVISIAGINKSKEDERKEVLAAQKKLADLTDDLVATTTQEPMPISKDAQSLLDMYFEYNAIRSDNSSRKYPISKLSRKHKSWLALKLSGTYAILNRECEITEESYAYAINTVELIAADLKQFEKELAKEPYEVLAHYCREMAEEGVFSISLHELRKLEYVTGSGTPKLKVQDLASLAASYDNDAIYTVKDDGIEYRELTKTSIKGTSYITFDTEREGEELKTYMEEHCDKGYEHIESTFEELADLLESNAAYTPFKFKNGKRNRENLEGGCSWLALDVDKSCLTDKEVHILLSEYKHHIARTSNPDNEYKFRVLIELDTLVEIDRELWKHFIQEVGNLLGLIIDPLAQSQIFFSYEGREILSQMDADPLESKPLIDKAIQTINSKPKKPRKLSKVQRSDLLEAPDDTFNFAFTAENGEGSRQVYRALAYAIDLGADEEYVRNLAHEINNYWHTSMPEERLERTLIIPILRRLTQCPG